MKQNYLRLLTILVLCFAVVSVSFAQNRRGASIPVADLYKISASAGGVNLIEGKVTSVRKNGKSGLLIKGETIEVGDKVTTDSIGKAEILLNPGSYLRLSENSEFEFTNSSLDNLQVKITRGSVIMEVITNSDDGFIVGVQTPQNKVFIIESGVYRFDVLADAASQVEVWKGKVQIGIGKAGIIKGGKTATLNGSQVAIAKFDRDKKDSFEIWSKARAKELSVANAGLIDKSGLRTSLMSGFYGRSWNAYDSYGVWILNIRGGGWCFMPFGYGFNSPYGFGFGRNLWDYNLPYQIIYTSPSNGNTNTNTNVKPPVVRTDDTPIGRGQRETPRQRPVVDISGSRDDRKSDGPIFSPPTRSEPIIITPPQNTDRKPNN
jgi:FecR protein